MKATVDNSEEKFGHKTSIADLAQFFVSNLDMSYTFKDIYEAYKVEYKHELKRAQLIQNHGLMNFFFRDGSSLCISEA